MNNKCIGIVLRQQDFRDNDMILTVFTREYGKISLLARGIKKAKSKNANACSLFFESEFLFDLKTTSELQMLKTAERVTMYRHIYGDLKKQVIASLICEACEKLGVDESEYLYDLLKTCLCSLNEEQNDFGVLAFFVAKANELSGVNPNVECCVHCNSSTNIATISVIDGGFVCSNCFNANTHQLFSKDKLLNFRLFHKAGLEDYAVLNSLKQYSYEDVKPILDMFLEYSGIHLTSLKLLNEIILFEP